jgi:hypothetical protein
VWEKGRPPTWNQPMPAAADEPEQRICGLIHTAARERSSVKSTLALRPGFSTQCPDATDGANLRHEAGGVGYWF